MNGFVAFLKVAPRQCSSTVQIPIILCCTLVQFKYTFVWTHCCTTFDESRSNSTQLEIIRFSQRMLFSHQLFYPCNWSHCNSQRLELHQGNSEKQMAIAVTVTAAATTTIFVSASTRTGKLVRSPSAKSEEDENLVEETDTQCPASFGKLVRGTEHSVQKTT